MALDEGGQKADCRTDSDHGDDELPTSRKPGSASVDHLPADLALVVNAWPNLTAETRAAVLGLIDRQAAGESQP